MRPARLGPLSPLPDLDIRRQAGASVADLSTTLSHPAMAIVPKLWRHASLESTAGGIGPASRALPEALPGQSIAGGLPNGGVSVLPRRARPSRHRVGFGLSATLHAGFALAAFMLIPSAIRPLTERGGAPSATEVMLVGEVEANATLQGGRLSELDFAVAEVPQVETPVFPPASVELPEPSPPDVPHMPAELLVPRLDLPTPALAPDLLPPKPIANRMAVQKAGPVAKARPSRPPGKLEPRIPKLREAQGRQGEGQSSVSSRASARGGSGGAGAQAGTAAMSSYRTRLVAHLTRYKTYPEQAQDRGVTGRNAVTITLDRAGRVTGSGLSNGSGHSILDAATLAAVRRAQPFPPIPDGGPTSFTVTISLRYDLR
ncbi:MAG TPA: energy transducer TonB [Rhabdaerophilum sp.]|nr:energy transducer TonB [Rhabdaerophilum sp.]